MICDNALVSWAVVALGAATFVLGGWGWTLYQWDREHRRALRYRQQLYAAGETPDREC